MTENLLKFDMEAFKADPMRVRYLCGSGEVLLPAEAGEVLGIIAVRWIGGAWPIIYRQGDGDLDYKQLRLSPKTRKVMARVYRDTQGKVDSVSGERHDLTKRWPFGYATTEWIKPLSVRLTDDGLIELEIPCE